MSEEIRAEWERDYRTAKRELCAEIKKAKDEAWQALLDSVDEDPWGLPYKVVLSRLRRSSPGLTETLNPADLELLLASLFPAGPTHDPVELWRDHDEQQMEVEEVSVAEVTAAMKGRKRGGNPAPGPDSTYPDGAEVAGTYAGAAGATGTYAGAAGAAGTYPGGADVAGTYAGTAGAAGTYTGGADAAGT
ncbi:hypothetical protein DMN91_002839 [Ooceraea biroi]|uniref:Uncharacterized protein n=1 Tax=Ooceraea biroi TaxID=2015173 RepID=A0A3L8DXS7_OOCBI|nr:hypothetical protein DMN91_002839 [Ooceraea biroi]